MWGCDRKKTNTTKLYSLMSKNTNYESPEVKIMEIISEGILCTSIPGYGDGSFEDYDEIGW